MAKREPWNPLLKSYPESEKINACSFEAETMFTRLIAKSDDNANYYGEPALLASYLYGHRLANGSITVGKTKRIRNELVTNKLLVMYESGGKTYIHVPNCKKSLRNDIKKDERFPEFTQDLAVKGHPESVTDPSRISNESVPSTQPNPTQPDQIQPNLFDPFEDWWKNYPRKKSKAAAKKSWNARMKEKVKPEFLTACLANYAREIKTEGTEAKFIMHGATFLGPSKRFEDYAPGTWKASHDASDPDDPYGEKYWEDVTDESVKEHNEEVTARHAARRAKQRKAGGTATA